MKLIYIFFGNHNNPTFKHKVIPFIRNLNSVDIQTKGLFFSEETKFESLDKENNILYVPLNFKIIPKLFLKGRFWVLGIFFKDYVLYKTFDKYIQKESFDYIFMRYNNSDFFFNRFLKKYPNKIITEHNSIEETVLKSYFKKSPKVFWKYRYYMDKYYAPKAFPKLAAVVGVTNEVTKYEIARSYFPKPPRYTLSNGIDINTVKLKDFTHFDGKNLNILFVSGQDNIWHGVDKIISGLANYDYKINTTLYIVGAVSEKNIQLARKVKVFEKIKFISHKYGEELDHYFNICHLAIASLALYRINTFEASILKVRQYLARGIPFIIGYNDTDLISEEEIKPYYLQIPNNEDAMDFNAVCDFAIRVLKDPFHPQKIRAFAEKKIDFSVKINLFKQFLHELNQ